MAVMIFAVMVNRVAQITQTQTALTSYTISSASSANN